LDRGEEEEEKKERKRGGRTIRRVLADSEAELGDDFASMACQLPSSRWTQPMYVPGMAER
jgi:hypothetical protein